MDQKTLIRKRIETSGNHFFKKKGEKQKKTNKTKHSLRKINQKSHEVLKLTTLHRPCGHVAVVMNAALMYSNDH